MRNFTPPPRPRALPDLTPLTTTCLNHGYDADTLDAIALAFTRAADQLRAIREVGGNA